MKKTLFLFAILISFGVSSQIEYSGNITTPEGDTLIGAQFGIYAIEDTTFLKGDMIENNQFEFNYSKKPFFIKVFSVAHKDEYIRVDPEPQNGKYTIPTINLQPKENLDQVTVTSTRPMFDRSLKGIKVNVANTPLSELQTLFDVLKASPKIMSPDDETITIVGSGAPTIYVDRQEILSMDELKAIPAAFVDKIDIITNPSARYSASGSGGVIEVYTLNYHMEGAVTSIGLNGSINTKAQPSLGGNINTNFKKKKFSLNFSINGSYGKYINPNSSLLEYTDSSEITQEMLAENRGAHYWAHGNLKIRYDFNRKHSLTAGIKGWGGGNKGNSEENEDYIQHSVLNQSKNSFHDEGNVWINPTANLNYKWQTDSSGSYFNTRFQYNFSVRDGKSLDNSTFYDYLTPNTTGFRRKTDSRNRPHVFTTFIDYVHIFGESGWEIAAGGFHSGLINDKVYNQYNFEDQDWILDSTFSNEYDYKENIAALYFDFEKEWKKVSMKMGVRGEGTFINGFSQALNKQIIDTFYINLFPSATFMFKFNKDWSMTVAYNSRISRPKFENYDPFIRQPDSTSLTFGNPNLLPEYAHVASIEFGYKYGYSLSFSYTRTNRPISNRTFIDSNTYILMTTPDNASYSDQIGVNLSIPINFKWWRGYNSFWANYNKYNFPDNFGRDPFGNFAFGLYLYEQFFLPKDWIINTSLNVNSWANSEMFMKPQVYWSAGIGKKLLDGDLNLRFDVNNIVPPKNKSTSYGSNYIQTNQYQWAFTTFKLSVTYKFGRLKAVQRIEDAEKNNQLDRF
ncbi:MAG: TonB-dependent receptor family protein [Crocinitomicaceae bacterium]|nr:TonB-dependent receptor family protein [Crocinitomicaceae bacterium]